MRSLLSIRPARVRKGSVSADRSEEHTSELQSHHDLVCRLLLEKKNKRNRRAAGFDGRPELNIGQNKDITAHLLLNILSISSRVLSFAPFTFNYHNSVSKSAYLCLVHIVVRINVITLYAASEI